MNKKEVEKTVEEHYRAPDPKFYNKKYYNPEYHYYVEGPEVLRLYSGRDNSSPPVDFTDVLDSTYVNVKCKSFRLSVLNISIHSSFVHFSIHFSPNGQFIILMKKGLYLLNLEESTL